MPEPSSSQEPPDILHHFVDEAGDPTLFNAKGDIIVESLGCSRFFMMGVLEVDEPEQLAAALTALRTGMLADPYFAGIESFKSARKKTALLFHAKDDLPEVRRDVFRLISQQGPKIRFHAVVADKQVIARTEQHQRASTPGHRYRPDSLYDHLTGELFAGMHRFADEHRLCVARRGNKERNDAIRTALATADATFADRFGFRRKGQWIVEVSDPTRQACLQATDYFLWAVQRFLEIRFDGSTKQPVADRETGIPVREDRYLNLLWPQITEIHDLHFGPETGNPMDTCPSFNSRRPLPDSEKFKAPDIGIFRFSRHEAEFCPGHSYPFPHL
ncbi:MAG: DUF3800 domain-containing protein [Burkholderiales bacterium]|nr:DUF3800 domain-containing protein [Opitutaceae bacterium]